MPRSKNHTFLVSKNAKGAWALAPSGAHTAKVFETKDAAVKAARQSVRERGGVLEVKNSDGRTTKSFTLGRVAMAKLNEVEGVVLGRAGEEAFKEFDQQGLSPAQRRAKLRKDLSKFAAGTKGTASGRSAPTKPSKA
jgi:hypothetical protein